MNELSPYCSLPEAFRAILSERPDAVAYYFMTPEGARESRTYAAIARRVHQLARHLRGCGVTHGTRVAIISNTRPEWSEADLAIVWLGGITVSVYPSLPSHDVGVILADSGAEVVFVENEEQLRKLHDLQGAPLVVPGREEEVRITIRHIISFESIEGAPAVTMTSTLFEGDDEEGVPMAEIARDDIASLVYTSGTTGIPKGVMQTHRNHLSNVVQAAESGVFGFDGILFLYLPLAHSFARLVQWLGLLTPATVLYTRVTNPKKSVVDLSAVSTDLRTGGAHYVPSVPRLFEKIKSQVERMSAQRSLRGLVLRLTLWAAEQRRCSSGKPSVLVQIAFQGTEKVRHLLRRQIFGEQFRHGISGGARLPVDVLDFFAGLEMTILEGYGLTETCVATHVNRPDSVKRGTVGTPFRGIETVIADDGEILLRGPNIAIGYYQKPEETAEAWDAEGWFHTGDIGQVDPLGYLAITGRKKELLVTAGGKKVATQKIEGLLQMHRLISHAVLVGEGRPFCAALVTIDAAMLATIAKQRNRPVPEDPGSADWVMTELNGHLDTINKDLASFEQVKKLAVVSPEFSVENGLLTPTLKVRRPLVVSRYADVIEGLYAPR